MQSNEPRKFMYTRNKMMQYTLMYILLHRVVKCVVIIYMTWSACQAPIIIIIISSSVNIVPRILLK
jgi:hypothetical protein